MVWVVPELALVAQSNRDFQLIGVYWRSPEFGDLWCKSLAEYFLEPISLNQDDIYYTEG